MFCIHIWQNEYNIKVILLDVISTSRILSFFTFIFYFCFCFQLKHRYSNLYFLLFGKHFSCKVFLFFFLLFSALMFNFVVSLLYEFLFCNRIFRILSMNLWRICHILHCLSVYIFIFNQASIRSFIHFLVSFGTVGDKFVIQSKFFYKN